MIVSVISQMQVKILLYYLLPVKQNGRTPSNVLIAAKNNYDLLNTLNTFLGHISH